MSATVKGRDKRAASRTRVLGHAQILASGGPFNCVVRDLSDTGAKLGVSRHAKLPSSFFLWFVKRDLKLRVHLKWREGDYAGVSFETRQQAPKSPRAGKDRKYIVDG